jgi:transcriptional regulator with XRE-family HTH domain
VERTADEYATASGLFGTGLSDREIARRVGISQSTISRWHRSNEPPLTVRRHERSSSWRISNADRYCYLLGAYLGDGTLSHQEPNFWSLAIVNDRLYSDISAEILRAMAVTFPGSTPRLWASWRGKSDVLHIAHPAIRRAIPQHGAGRKHTRPIVLEEWQRRLTRAHPDALIRGLIHSDGCRSINHVKTTLPRGRIAEYHYVRYFFTNHSTDILEIFTEHCELLGVRVTQSNPRNLSVSHRDSVAVLEEVVGPKS